MIDLTTYPGTVGTQHVSDIDMAIWEQLKRIADSLENFNFEQIGEYKHASTQPVGPTPTRYLDGNPVFATSEDAFHYMAYNDKPAYSEESLKFDNDNRSKGLDD